MQCAIHSSELYIYKFFCMLLLMCFFFCVCMFARRMALSLLLNECEHKLMFTQNHPSISTSEKSLLISFSIHPKHVVLLLLFFYPALKYIFRFSQALFLWDLTLQQPTNWNIEVLLALNVFSSISLSPFVLCSVTFFFPNSVFFYSWCKLHMSTKIINGKFVNTKTFLSNTREKE